MYRILLQVLLCTSAVTPAPQSDSKITYVKIQPTINTKPRISRQTSGYVESKIQNIPLTISNAANKRSEDKPSTENQALIDPIEINDSAESQTESFQDETTFRESNTEPFDKPSVKLVDHIKSEKSTNNQSASIFDPHEINASAEQHTENEFEANSEERGGDKAEHPEELLVESPSDTILDVKTPEISALPTGRSLSDSTPDETPPSHEKAIDSFPSASITENHYIYATTNFIEETTTISAVDERTDIVIPTYSFKPKPRKSAPKFYPKLSYFKKTEDFYGGASTNFVQRGERKKYKSNCRCEKIWNCPRLQITVPRCPNEYFLCCF